MAEEGYKTTTIYQTRIALYNMLEFARGNDVLISNPCKKSVKSDMGKPSAKKEALTIDVQKKFLEAVVGYSYENQYRFVLQTEIRTGDDFVIIGLNQLETAKHKGFQRIWSYEFLQRSKHRSSERSKKLNTGS